MVNSEASSSAGETGNTTCLICGAALVEPSIHGCDRLHGTPGTHLVAVCRNCGAGTTLPEVTEDQLGAFYPEEYGPYDGRMSGPERLLSRAIRAFQGWNALRSPPLIALDGRPPGRGIDIGCGRGDLAATLLHRGWRMSGVEPSPTACELATQRGIDVECGTLSTVALPSEAYDAVLFHHSLEHTTDPVTALRHAASALIPGGLVLITVPNFASWQARRFGSCWYHLDLPRHRVHFTPLALGLALRSAKFTSASLSTSSTAVGLPASVQYRIFGRCLCPSGFRLRIASSLCAAALPVTKAFDRRGGGDVLHAVAQRTG